MRAGRGKRGGLSLRTMLVLALLLAPLAAPVAADAPPVIVVEPVATVECVAGHGTVSLDASASYDPEGAPLVFSWSGPEGATFTAPTAARTEMTSPMQAPGVATLTASDGAQTATANVPFLIQDTVAPTTTFYASPSTRLPTGWYINAQVRALVEEACDPQPQALVELTHTRTGQTIRGNGIGVDAPGNWTTRTWARDFAGNEGPWVPGPTISVVRDLNLDARLSATPGTRHVRFQTDFDRTFAVAGATIEGRVEPVGVPTPLWNSLKHDFVLTTNETGGATLWLPHTSQLPLVEYRLAAAASIYGKTASVTMTYTG